MRKIYSTTVIGQAAMLQVILRRHGIESRLENEGGAMYAIGLPTAAAPIVIVVDDDRAEEAARILADEFTKPRTPDPTQVMIQMPCACGKTLEFPKGEEPPAECPWCNRPTQAAPAPGSVPSPPPVPRVAAAVIGVVVLGLILLAAFGVFAGYRGFQSARRSWRESGGYAGLVDPHPALARRLRERIEAIPTPTLPAIDPDAIAIGLSKELPEEAARFVSALDPAATVGDFVDRWLRLTADLQPDWAAGAGLVEGRRLGRYTARSLRSHVLMNAQALRKLRSMRTEVATFDGRLMERLLERALLFYLLFGADVRDPRAACWGLQASFYLKDRPSLLAERLEQVPEVVAEVRRELRDVTAPMIDISSREINEALQMLLNLEQTSTDARTLAAVGKARDALSDFASHLRKMTPAPPRPVDPRWILFLVRDAEFSRRTAREAARLLFDEAERALPRWNAQGGTVKPVQSAYTTEEWRAEVRRFVARARDLTVERNFAELPENELPEVIDSPLLSRGSSNLPAYGPRTLSSTPHGILWLTLWDTSQSRTESLSATSGLICTLAETYPGRHLHEILSRRDGTVARRVYMSHGFAEGWRAYCQRWAIETVPNAAYDAVYADGIRFSQSWAAAVEICFLSGTLSESEAVEMLTSALGESAEDARLRLAWSFVEPLYGAGSILGELDLLELRNEMKAKLGTSFDLKRFHTRLLGYGRAPVALIREEMLRAAK